MATPLSHAPSQPPESTSPAAASVSHAAPQHAPRTAAVTPATEKAAAAAAAAREAAREAMEREAAEKTAREAAREGGAPASGGVDNLAARWLQGAAQVATRWLKPGEGDTAADGAADVKRSWSRSAGESRGTAATTPPFGGAGKKSPRELAAAPGAREAAAQGKQEGAKQPLEEVARYGSPRPGRARDDAGAGTPRGGSSASKKGGKDAGGNALAPQPPTAAEVAQLRKMIVSSFGKDGAPRLDSVSLYALGKLLGKGAFGAVKMGVHKLSGAVVAIKNFKKADVKNEVESRAIDREIRILKQSVHQHIIKLYAPLSTPHYLPHRRHVLPHLLSPSTRPLVARGKPSSPYFPWWHVAGTR